MKEEKFLKDKFGTNSGFSVPENYFDNTRNKILEDLPPVVRMNPVAELSRWQKIKPYLYLAAMFVGIWCMMKLFHTVSSDYQQAGAGLSDDAIALLNGGPLGMEYDTPESFQSDYELMVEAETHFDDFADFERSFNETLANT